MSLPEEIVLNAFVPLDHYVSQVHLKQFRSPDLHGLMYAIRKHDLKSFTPNTRDVCRIEDGSTNAYLREERAIEEFLKGVEPKYEASLEKITNDKIDRDAIFVISGFVSYLIVCSPAGMRIQADPLKRSLEQVTRIIDSKGLFPKPPLTLEDKSLTELMLDGTVSLNVDHKFPQAIGITSIQSHTVAFGNFHWEILLNPFGDCPFFTSDFPVAVEITSDPQILNRIIPLSPYLAIRICPKRSLDRRSATTAFSDFTYERVTLNRHDVVSINRLIVRCAETLVFFRTNYEWISEFVRTNARFRIEPKTQQLPTKGGAFLLFTQEVTDRRSS